MRTSSTIKRSEVVRKIEENCGRAYAQDRECETKPKSKTRRQHKVYSIEVNDTCADLKGMSSWKVKGRTRSGGRCGGCEGR